MSGAGHDFDLHVVCAVKQALRFRRLFWGLVDLTVQAQYRQTRHLVVFREEIAGLNTIHGHRPVGSASPEPFPVGRWSRWGP